MSSNGNGRIDNRTFAATDTGFQNACKRAGIPPSQRQASKFRLGFGKAWEHRYPYIEEILERIERHVLTAASK